MADDMGVGSASAALTSAAIDVVVLRKGRDVQDIVGRSALRLIDSIVASGPQKAPPPPGATVSVYA